MSSSTHVSVRGKGRRNVVDLSDGGEHDEYGMYHFLQGFIVRSV